MDERHGQECSCRCCYHHTPINANAQSKVDSERCGNRRVASASKGQSEGSMAGLSGVADLAREATRISGRLGGFGGANVFSFAKRRGGRTEWDDGKQ